MHAIVWLAKKDLTLLFRDKVDLFFTFLFPLFVAVFFGSIFGGGGGQQSAMKLAVVDEDGTAGSAAFVQRLAGASEFDVVRDVRPRNDAPARALTRDGARELVRRGDAVAAVVVPKGFGDGNMFSGQAIRLEGYVDPSHGAEAGMIQGLLTKYAFQGMAEMFGDSARMRDMARKSLQRVRESTGMDPEMKRALEGFLPSVEKFFVEAPADPASGAPDKKAGGIAGWEPVKIDLQKVSGDERGPPSGYAISFPQAVVWGVLGCVMSFGISLTTERTGGTLVRLVLAPIGRWQILAGKAAACFVTALVVIAMIMLLGWGVFKIVPASPGLLVAAAVSIAAGFVGVMMLLAALSRTAGGASGLGRAVLLVLAMIGGGSIPLFVMPRWLLAASSVSPFKWAVQALDLAIWRARSPVEMVLPCAVLVGIGVVGFVVGARLFGWGERG